MGFDILTLSFVGRGEDVREARRLVEGFKPPRPVKVVAKIEDRTGVRNLGEILEAAEGVLVGRGDLAVQTSFAELPGLQETIIRRAREAGRWSVVATQVMEGMMHSPVPTRAEVMDVALAVRQGASAILLSGETARGRNPVETVAMVREIAAAAADQR